MIRGKRVQYRRRRRFPYWRVVILALLLCAGVAAGYSVYRMRADASPEEDVKQGSADLEDNESEQDGETPVNSDGVMPEIDENGEIRQPGQDSMQEGSAQEGAGQSYTFGTPVPESESVDDSWFEDAVFLGDSRTEGLQLYSGITSGTFFWEWGMSVFKVDDTNHRKVSVNGEKMTLMEALSTGTWEKVYIMIGINDLGYPAQSYQKALGEMIDQVREIQSGAAVYLQTMPPVNEALAQANGIAYYINNENVKAFNEAIAQIAAEKQVILLDTASCLSDGQGQLPEDMSSDGVHFKKVGYQTWLEYLKSHTVDPEEIQSARTQQGGEMSNQ